jgi:flagellar basal body-associated protein FliL
MDNLTPQMQQDIQPGKPSVTTMESNSKFQQLHRHHLVRILIVIASILLVIAAVVIVWLQFFHKKPEITPQQTLQQLKNTSLPVTTTAQQRAANLSQASKNSIQYVVTQKEETATFNALRK